jgi:hypothetical protein
MTLFFNGGALRVPAGALVIRPAAGTRMGIGHADEIRHDDDSPHERRREFPHEFAPWRRSTTFPIISILIKNQ